MAYPFRVVTIKNMWGIRVLMAICVALGVSLASASVASGPLVPTSIAPALPGTSSGKPGPGMFLVARRALDGSHFGQSVIYLVEHDEDGTLGLIVNRGTRHRRQASNSACVVLRRASRAANDTYAGAQ